MKDQFLQIAVKMAEAEPPLELGVTLIVDGFLISGTIVNKHEYFSHHPFPQKIFETYKELYPESETEEKSSEGSPRHYIHLRDAKYYTPGQPPIPGNASVYCRIALEKVSGFSFGTLAHEVS